MNAQQVKDMLNKQDVFDLLVELDANPRYKGNLIYARTICHGGHKHKLVYYPDTKQFYCFTDCQAPYDIFSLISTIFNIDFSSAFRYICNKFNINAGENIYVPSEDKVDTSFIKKFESKEPSYTLNEIPKTLLNRYFNLYHQSWIDDGISIETMRKFGIMFSINENKIIIPHFDVNGRLLGVRGRALNQEDIDEGRKYMPVYHPKMGVLKHPTGANLYGVHVNKEKIQQTKSVILLESEKGPMQLDTMQFHIPGVGISGSSISDEQIKILVDLGVENVILGLDKEFKQTGTEEELFYKKKVTSGFIDKMLPYFRLFIIWDTQNLLDYKDAPTDKGREVFEKLFEKRIFI